MRKDRKSKNRVYVLFCFAIYSAVQYSCNLKLLYIYVYIIIIKCLFHTYDNNIQWHFCASGRFHNEKFVSKKYIILKITFIVGSMTRFKN